MQASLASSCRAAISIRTTLSRWYSICSESWRWLSHHGGSTNQVHAFSDSLPLQTQSPCLIDGMLDQYSRTWRLNTIPNDKSPSSSQSRFGIGKRKACITQLWSLHSLRFAGQPPELRACWKCESMTGMWHDNIANHPLLSLALSLIPLSLAIYGTVTGTAVFKTSRADRSKQPFNYWLTLAFEYCLFVWLFSLFLRGV
jgi:hypothetical protein